MSRNASTTTPTWDFPSNGLPVESGYISSVTPDPADGDVVYATCSTFGQPHVYRSADGGLNWTPIDGAGVDSIPDVPAHWIVVRPGNSDQLFVGTEIGVFESADAGATWRPAGVDLPTTVCEALEFQDEDTLVVFTHGRGTFVTDLIGPCNDADLGEPYGTLDLADIVAFVSGVRLDGPRGRPRRQRAVRPGRHRRVRHRIQRRLPLSAPRAAEKRESPATEAAGLVSCPLTDRCRARLRRPGAPAAPAG